MEEAVKEDIYPISATKLFVSTEFAIWEVETYPIDPKPATVEVILLVLTYVCPNPETVEVNCEEEM